MDEKTIGNHYEEPDQPMQSIDVIMQIIAEVSILEVGTLGLNHYMTDNLDIEDLDSESELDIDSSGEIIYILRSRYVYEIIDGSFFVNVVLMDQTYGNRSYLADNMW